MMAWVARTPGAIEGKRFSGENWLKIGAPHPHLKRGVVLGQARGGVTCCTVSCIHGRLLQTDAHL